MDFYVTANLTTEAARACPRTSRKALIEDLANKSVTHCVRYKKEIMERGEMFPSLTVDVNSPTPYTDATQVTNCFVNL